MMNNNRFTQLRSRAKREKLSLLSLALVLLMVIVGFFPLPTTSQMIPRQDYDYILLYNKGQGSFTCTKKGDSGSQASLQMDFEGLSVYAQLSLSQFKDAGIDIQSYHADWYYIYPQKVTVRYSGHYNQSLIEDPPDRRVEKNTDFTWSVAESYNLPIPSQSYSVNQCSRWKSQVQQLQREKGFGGGFVIADRRAVGGKVICFPHFMVFKKDGIRVNSQWQGYEKATGKQWSGKNSQTGTLSFGFCGVAAGLYLQGQQSLVAPGVDWYKYYSTEPLAIVDDFSISSVDIAKQGMAEDILHFYKQFSQRKYYTVTSDKKVHANYQYRLSFAKSIDALLHKVEKEWRPKGGDDSTTVDVTAEIKEEGLKGRFRFTLFDVSNEKGYSMNKGEESDLDLTFVDNQKGFSQEEATDDGYVIETLEEKRSATVQVQSLDYGAWGRVKAEVYLDGTWHTCEAEGGGTDVTIPYDDDENHLADVWEEEMQVSGKPATWDGDTRPEDVGDPAEPGDGYSNYEEYRGFYVNGEWTDTDPLYKDIFIYDELGFGIGLFTELNLHVHLIEQTEFDENRFVNCNRGYGTLETQDGQKGLHLKGGGLQGAVGMTNGDIADEDGVGCPNVIKEVVVDALGAMQISGMIMPDDVMEDYLTNPIKVVGDWDVFYGKMDVLLAHELGHAVNIMHHGDERFVPSYQEAASTSDDWEAENFEKVWNSSESTALEGGKWSGDVRCVMRYDPPINYFGWDKKFYGYPEDEGEDSRSTFCTSSKGTGINAGPQRRVPNNLSGKPYPVAGDATWGNCKGMVDLKGEHYFGDVEWLRPSYAGDEDLKEEYKERYKNE